MDTPYYAYFEVREVGGGRAERRRQRPKQSALSPIPTDGNSIGHYVWNRSRSLEHQGASSRDEGIYGISGSRVFHRYGLLPAGLTLAGTDESAWPSDIDGQASLLRVHHYHRLIGTTEVIESLKRTRSGVTPVSEPVQVECAINERWHSPEGGRIPLSESIDPIEHVHAFSIPAVAEDPVEGLYFPFQNSWGPDWGDRGLGVFFLAKPSSSTCSQRGRAMAVGGRLPIPDSGTRSVLWKWAGEEGPAQGVHGREIVDCETGLPLAWAFAKVRAGHLDLEEFVVWPTARRSGYGRLLGVDGLGTRRRGWPSTQGVGSLR